MSYEVFFVLKLLLRYTLLYIAFPYSIDLFVYNSQSFLVVFCYLWQVTTSVLGMTLNSNRWWGSISLTLVSVEYSFIAISSRSMRKVHLGKCSEWDWEIGSCEKNQLQPDLMLKEGCSRNYSAIWASKKIDFRTMVFDCWHDARHFQKWPSK